MSDTVSGHTSKPYNSSGKHLLLIIFKVTPSEALNRRDCRASNHRHVACYGASYKPHYASCPSVCLTVCPSFLTRKQKGIEPHRKTTISVFTCRTEVTDVLVFNSKAQRPPDVKNRTKIKADFYLLTDHEVRRFGLRPTATERTAAHTSALGADIFACS